MPPPITQTSTWTFCCSGPHSGIGAVADNRDSWRGMRCPLQQSRPALLTDLRRPPALQLRVDARRALDLRQRALLPGLVFALPFGDQRVGLGEGVLERAAGGQRLLEEGAAEVGEVVLVGAAERAAVVPRGSDDQCRVVAQRLDEAAGIAGGDHDHFPADAAFLEESAELLLREIAQLHRVLLQREL